MVREHTENMKGKEKSTEGDTESALEGLDAEAIMREMDNFRRRMDIDEVRDAPLWRAYREVFEDFTIDHFKNIGRSELLGFRSFLRKRGVWVSTSSKSISTAQALMDVLEEDTQTEWTEEEVAECDPTENFTSYIMANFVEEIRRLRKATAKSNMKSDDTTRGRRRSSLYPKLPALSASPSPAPEASRFRLETIDEEENSGKTKSHYPTPPPDTTKRPKPSTTLPTGLEEATTDPITVVATPNHHRTGLMDITKVYTDEMKYGDGGDSLAQKLTIFHDLCDRAEVKEEHKLRALPAMLKGLALDFFYANMTVNPLTTFNQAVMAISQNFEGAEYRRGLMIKWNNLTLEKVIDRSGNEDKSIDDCLHLLIRELHRLQHGLDMEFRNEKFMHNKLITACQGVDACKYACYKPADTLNGFINDLHSSIATFTTKSSKSDTFFTDRRYRKNFERTNRPERGKPFNNRASTPYRGKRKLKCYVCGKEGCYSTNHPKDEQDSQRKKWRERYNNRANKRFDQFMAEMEGTPGDEGEDEDGDSDEDEGLSESVEALVIDCSPSPEPEAKFTESFITSFGPLSEAFNLTEDLSNRSFGHCLGIDNPTCIDQATTSKGTTMTSYLMEHNRYTSDTFYGIMIDTGAAEWSTAGYGQYLAFKKFQEDVAINTESAGRINVKFGVGRASSIGSVNIRTPIGLVEFHIMQADIPFLLSLADLDRLECYFNNLTNRMVTKHGSFSVIRRFGHPFMLWDRSLYNHIAESFSYNPSQLSEEELRRLHRRFGHPSALKLHNLLERSDHQINKKALERLTKYCVFCQKHSKSPGRFKFTLREDVHFNFTIFVDIMYIESSPVLHVVDEATRYQAARWLKDISAKHTWDMLRLCWIDVYLGPPDHIQHDAGKNFISKEFRQLASSMGINTKAVPVEAHWSIGIVERYHATVRRAFKAVTEDLAGTGVTKEMGLQMAMKAINDTAGPNGIVPTLLVFGAYPRMTDYDAPSPSVVQRSRAIQKAMQEVRKIRAQQQVNDALNTRNGPFVDHLHDLPLNSEVLVWREGISGRLGRWTGPYKLLGMDGETCKVDLPHGVVSFRSTVVKPFLRDDETGDVDEIQSEGDNPDDEASKSIDKPSPNETGDEIPQINAPTDENSPPGGESIPHLQPAKRARGRPRKYPLNPPDVAAYLQYEDIPSESSSFSFSSDIRPFVESRKKEINGLLDKGVFELISVSEVPAGVRIFNSRFVDEIKNIGTHTAFEKSRLVVQAYNDRGKEEILTQAPTIQRMSQRLILALAATTGLNLYLRDISQAYVQSTTALNREFYIRPPIELGLEENAILRVLKPLYGVPEAGAHWYNTYHKHHLEKLAMQQSTYDPCLLYSNKAKGTGFGVVGLQIDDTLILGDEDFIKAEEFHLHEAKLLAKDRDKLTTSTPIKFNGGYIKQTEKGLYLSQERLCKGLRQVNTHPTDITSARGMVRKAVTPKDQYIAQRARGAYIASLSQPEAAFDLSFAAQVINPKEEDAKALNKRLLWQMENYSRGLRFVRLDSSSLRLITFVDASFANNLNLSSQIGFVICLADAANRANIIHWSSTKCKRVTRSVLASELYAMAHGFDAGAVIKSTTERVLQIPVLPMIICTDSKSLYDCLVKLSNTQEKRLMIDIMSLRQSYERREIMEVRWIDGDSNPADAMTKARPCEALRRLIDTNMVSIETTGWVERKELTKQEDDQRKG